MKRILSVITLLLAAALLITGCSMMTTEQMYCLPKRSEDYNDLQSTIDSAMSGLSYCAPLSGENQQPVQMADLDGDGINEYLLFAKGTQERPLHILVFRNVDGTYVHTDTVQSNGTSFDMVEYVDMDARPGVEVVVGRQVSDQVIRSVSIYTAAQGRVEQMLTVNYTKFLTVDLDNSGISKLFVVRPGNTDTDTGIVELYSFLDGDVERSNEVTMSQPADKLKRVIVGNLHGGSLAVYLASAVEDTALITDVYTVRDGMLTNVTVSNESGTSIQTLRNFYVYADDIDSDGVVELPTLLTMKSRENTVGSDKHHMIRWYAMTPEGDEIEKMHTFHNFEGGWYLQLDSKLVARLTVAHNGNSYEFYMWDEEYKTTQKLMTVATLTAQSKNEQTVQDGWFVLHRTDTATYAASLAPVAEELGITQDTVIYSFRMIQQDWKTGET